MSDAEKRTLPLHMRAVQIDETSDWTLIGEGYEKVEKIYGIYLYDLNEQTYCCEMTPSRYLYYIETIVVFKEEVSDEIRDGIQDDINEVVALNDIRGHYMHCRYADALEGRTFDPETVSFDDVSYEDQVEAWLEYARCNSLI
jgi:hypothetical protein